MAMLPTRSMEDKRLENQNPLKRAAPADDSDEAQSYQPSAHVYRRIDSGSDSNSKRQKLHDHSCPSVMDSARLNKPSGDMVKSNGNGESNEDYDMDQEDVLEAGSDFGPDAKKDTSSNQQYASQLGTNPPSIGLGITHNTSDGNCLSFLQGASQKHRSEKANGSQASLTGHQIMTSQSLSQPVVRRTSQYVDCSIRYPNSANPLATSTDALRVPEEFMADTLADLNNPKNRRKRLPAGRKAPVKAPAPFEVAWWCRIGPYSNANTPSEHLRIDALTKYLGWDNETNKKRGYEKKRKALMKIYPLNDNLERNDPVQIWKQHYERHLKLLKDQRKNHSQAASQQSQQLQLTTTAAPSAGQAASRFAESAPMQGVWATRSAGRQDAATFGPYYHPGTQSVVSNAAPNNQMFVDLNFSNFNDNQTTLGSMHFINLTPLADVFSAPQAVQPGMYLQHQGHTYNGFAQTDAYGAPLSFYGGRISTNDSSTLAAGAYIMAQQGPHVPPTQANNKGLKLNFDDFLWNEPHDE